MKRRVLMMLFAAALAMAWPLARGLRIAWYEYNNFDQPRTRPTRPRDAAALGLLDAEFRTSDGLTMRGWYIPSRTGASVILVGGSGSDRNAMLDHARALCVGGTGALLFDLPGTGFSDGRAGVGEGERAAVAAAVDYVRARPDVHHGRIGIIGFSLGSWASLLIGAADARIRAFVVEGVFDDPWSQTKMEYEDAGPLAQWGALLGARLAGMERSPGGTREAVRLIAPRPLLFVAGTRDMTVPASLTRAVYDAASEPKQFWLIKGAAHGGYVSADSSFGPRLRAYVESVLADSARAHVTH